MFKLDAESFDKESLFYSWKAYLRYTHMFNFSSTIVNCLDMNWR